MTEQEEERSREISPASSNPKDEVQVEIDSQPTQRVLKKRKASDVFAIVCAGFALISDGYHNNLMTMLNVVFGLEYPKDYTDDVKTRVSNGLLVGEIIGQVLIGLTCDYMGRKWAMTVTTALIVVGAIMSCAAGGPPHTLFWVLAIGRGITGVGAGGEYPASSAAASESANEVTRRRGLAFVMVTNLPLAFGGPFALIIFLIVWSASNKYEVVWRVCIGLGIVWPLSVFYFRFKMHTSKLYKQGAIKKKVPYWLSIKFYWKRLIGTCGAWFLYDFVTFPNGIFSGTIIAGLLGKDAPLIKTAEWQLLLGVIALPGVFIGGFLVDKIGRKYTMMIGFTGYIIFGLIIGCAFDKLSAILPLFIIFYGLMNSSGNLGPGNCLGLVSSESYPSAIRGTFYGFSAAIGKVGSVAGSSSFVSIQNHLGKNYTFIIAAVIGLVGVVTTFFFVPHLKEDDLIYEDQRYHAYLRANGWNGQFGEEHSEIDVDVQDEEQGPAVMTSSSDAKHQPATADGNTK